MKFFEVTEPYYALIKAKTKEIAKDEYVKVVAEDEDGNLVNNLKEVDRDYAVAVYSRTLSEDGKEIPINEILENIKDDVNMVLIVDGSLR